MRLIIDVRSLVGVRNKTGVSRYTDEMISALQRVISPDTTEIRYFGSGLQSSNFISNIPGEQYTHIHLPNKILSALWMLRLSKGVSSFISGDYLWLPNAAIINTGSIPYCLTVHDLSFLKHPEYFNLKRRLWHYTIRFQALIKNAHRIVAVSESTRDDLLDHFPYLRPDRIAVIYPGIPNFLLSNRNDVLENNEKRPYEYFLFVGSLEPRKNLDIVLKSFEMLSHYYPQLELVIAGPYGWSSKKTIAKINNAKNVQWLKYVSGNDLSVLYSNALSLVWPSFYEGFGFPPLEALEHNTPIITSYRASLPEILKNNAYYINPYSVSDLVRVMTHILKRKNKKNVIDHGMRYSWDSSARSLLQFITSQ